MNVEPSLPRLPSSGTAQLLSQTVLGFDAKSGIARLGFVAPPSVSNPAGFVQGGVLSAMLDDTLVPVVWLATDGQYFPVTINLTVAFLAAARPGPIAAEARLIHLGKLIAHAEAELRDKDGVRLARASASMHLVRADTALATPDGGGTAPAAS